MLNVKASRVIRVAPDKLWQLATDVDRLPEWMPPVVEARVKGRTRKNSGLGRQQVLKTHLKLGKGESLLEVIAWEPPHRITWQHLKDVVDNRELDYAKEIKTTLTMTNIDSKVTLRLIGTWVPVGISGRLMNRFMKRLVSKTLEKALENLEALLEAKHPVSL